MPRYVTGRATELVETIELGCAPGDVVLIIRTTVPLERRAPSRAGDHRARAEALEETIGLCCARSGASTPVLRRPRA
jgi:hypothetical protein